MKISKMALVFTLLFSCVCGLKAQVIESVAYTPTKSGNYGTITTKSLAVFGGDVSVDNGQGTITGLGEKFVLDTKGFNNISLGSGRDVYSTVTTVSTGTTRIAGTLNTTNSTTITTLSAPSGDIYGGDTYFPKTAVTLNRAGVLEIHDVTMNNPKCQIQWVQLPAYTQTEDYDHFTATESNPNPTPTLYWFAFCEPTAGEDTTSGRWETSTRTAKVLGTCTDGWDGGVYLEGNSPTSDKPCTYTAGHLSGTFTE